MKLYFTNGYRPRFDQISRIMKFLLLQDGKNKILNQEIVTALGIPKKQVSCLTSMMIGFGLVKTRATTLTDLGIIIIENDPFFARLETLWIIHYIVSSNPEWIVWHRIINSVIPNNDEYEIEKINRTYFKDLEGVYSLKTIIKNLPNEVSAVFSAYARTEFSKLSILKEENTGRFIKMTPVDIPCLAFLYCIYFYKRNFPGSTALNVNEICIAENSPGNVLNMPEYKVRLILEELHDTKLIRLEKFANLDQVRFADSVSQVSILNKIYRGKDGN